MFSYIKYFIKQSLSLILYILGTLPWLKFRFRKEPALIILNYHNFSKYNNYKIKRGNILETAYAKNFEKQIRFLKKHFNFCYPEEFFNGKTKKGINILITFDDGYKDNYNIAAPILKKYNIPAIFFLATAYISNNKWLWHDKVRYLINLNRLNSSKAENILTRMNQGIEVPIEFKKEITQKFENISKKRLMMNWKEVLKLNSLGFKIGAHTTNHKILTFQNKETKEFEINNSINKINKKTDLLCNYFAYPNGLYDNETINYLKKNNITYGFTTETGYNNRNKNKFLLKRIGINASDTIQLLLLKIFINNFK